MIVKTAHFGDIDVNEEQILSFPDGLLGMEDLHRFIIAEDENTAPISWLQSIDNGSIALPVVNVFDVEEEYILDVGDEDIERLQIAKPEEVVVLVVTTIPKEVQKMTVNLAAPLVINTGSGLGRQVMASTPYSLRHPAYDAVMRVMERRLSNAGVVSQGE